MYENKIDIVYANNQRSPFKAKIPGPGPFNQTFLGSNAGLCKGRILPYERNGPRRVLLIQKCAGITKSQIPKAKLSKLSEAVIFTSLWRHFTDAKSLEIIRLIFKGLQKAKSILKALDTYSVITNHWSLHFMKPKNHTFTFSQNRFFCASVPLKLVSEIIWSSAWFRNILYIKSIGTELQGVH